MAAATQAKSGTVPAGGIAEIRFSPTGRQSWIAQQVSVEAPAVGAGSLCGLYLDKDFITPLIATGDAAAGDPPIPVRLGQSLIVRWTSAAVGAQVKATVIYDDGERP